jgi:hypothetical protein
LTEKNYLNLKVLWDNFLIRKKIPGNNCLTFPKFRIVTKPYKLKNAKKLGTGDTCL